MTDVKGFRIWEIHKNGVPKEIATGDIENYDGTFTFHDLDLENKTYAIRIGKEGLK